MVRCRFCGREAVVYIPYTGYGVCSIHYSSFIEGKVVRAVKRYGLIDRGDRVLIALSGGKDSVVLTYILDKLSRENGFSIYLLHIDLGIGDYSRECRGIVGKIHSILGYKTVVVDIRDLLGLGVEEISRKTCRAPCSVCGIIKRYIMNTVAIEAKMDAVATGHNLDDIASYILKEFLHQNIEGMIKLSPKIDSVEDIAVKKIRPLYEVYEEEVQLYAKLNSIEYVSRKCPLKPTRSLEVVLKNKLNELEKMFPSIKIGFIRRFVKNLGKYPPIDYSSIRRCRVCGLISSTQVCSYCRLTEKVLGKPFGAHTRKYIRDLVEDIFS